MGTSDVQKRPPTRLAGLDLLRLLAIVLVLGRHIVCIPSAPDDSSAEFYSAWIRGGWVGVDVFFVLSGFLVSGLLFAEFKARGRLSVVRFYTRRGWKIYPPFFVLVAATVGMYRLRGEPIPKWQILYESLFLQSYFVGVWNHTWSLAVEEHFYILLPLVLLTLLAFRKGDAQPFRLVPAIALGLAVFAPLLARFANWYAREGFSHHTHQFATHLRFDSLFLGVAIAYAYHFHQGWFGSALGPYRVALVLAGLALLTPAFVVESDKDFFTHTIGFTAYALGGGALLVGVLLLPPPTNPALLSLAAVGTYSYSIYLWHMPMLRWGLPALEAAVGTSLSFHAKACVYLVGSFAGGVLMAKLIEVPTLRLRDLWCPSQTPAPLGAPPTDATPSRPAPQGESILHHTP